MGTPTTRVFTPARVVALAIIAMLVAGLVYTRFASQPDTVFVPAGAKAGDLILEPCAYATEDGDYDADCGTLVVPENSADPGSRLIALPVIRIHARSDHPGDPMFYLEGGPGITNMDFTQASRYAQDRDVVLVGYRGVDGSVRLDCPEVTSALQRSADLLGEESFRAYGEAFRACADRLADDGVDLAGYGLPQRVDDLEAARTALGYDRIDLLSQSAGTRTAMIFAWRYPERIHRSVMIGVNPPGHFLWDARTTDEQVGRYAELCSNDTSCSERTDDLAATMRQITVDIPDRWFFLPIKESNVRIASFYGLMESAWTGTMPSAPMTFDSWLSAAEGDASGLWFQSLFVDVLVPDAFVWGEYAAAGRLDIEAAGEYFSSDEQERGSIGYAGTAFAWGGGRLGGGWPAAPDEDAYSRARTSEVETLLIGGTLDTSTPPQVATEELLPYLPNGHQVVLPGFGHTASFFAEQPEAGSRLINAFFASGRVDDSLYEAQTVDFTPDTTLTAMAKIVAGAMVGLALIAVLSLLWMARHIHRRGGFGPKAGAVLRSISPVVLGLEGWFLAVLLVLATGLSIPLDNEPLAVLATCVPIGLGVYWAWVHRDWSARTKAEGFAAAAGGALVGAWLGFNATEGFFALITTIVGSAVGANLTLIALDISGARAGRLPRPIRARRSAV